MAKSKPTPESDATRFWSRVGPADANGCREWRGFRDQTDYGRFWRMGRTVMAQAEAWCLTYHGPTKPGARHFRHSCDHPWCVEPSHVYPGTSADNTADRHSKGRDAKGDNHGRRLHPDSVPWGERNGRSCLTEQQAREVKRRALAGEPCARLGRLFGVSHAAIRAIRNGRNWSWID